MQIDCCSWKLPSTHNWMTRAVDAVVFLQHVQNSFGTALSNCVQKGVQKSNDKHCNSESMYKANCEAQPTRAVQRLARMDRIQKEDNTDTHSHLNWLVSPCKVQCGHISCKIFLAINYVIWMENSRRNTASAKNRFINKFINFIMRMLLTHLHPPLDSNTSDR